MVCSQLRLSFELGEQATHLLGSPAFCCAVVVEEQLAFAFVVDDVCIGLHQSFQLLLAGGNGKAAVKGTQLINGIDRVTVVVFDLADLADRQFQAESIGWHWAQ